jgi:hypothetical protein
LCILWCIVGWRRRATPSGAFLAGACGSAVVYMATFIPVGVAGDFRYALWAVLAGLAGVMVAAVRDRAATDYAGVYASGRPRGCHIIR